LPQKKPHSPQTFTCWNYTKEGHVSESANIAETQARLEVALGELTGDDQPPDSLFDELGGWAAVEALAPQLVDHPLLAPLTALTCRHADTSDTSGALHGASALVGAVAACTDPYLFCQSLDYLCNSPELLDLVGMTLAESLWPLAGPPEQGPNVPAAVVQRNADALETYLRLTLARYGSKHRLFTLFESVRTPHARRYAQAVIRCVETARDLLDADDDVTATINVLSENNATATNGGIAAWTAEQVASIAPDVAWAHANIEFGNALRANDLRDILTHLDAARAVLTPLPDAEANEDAAVLELLLRVLTDFLRSAGQDPPEWNVDVAAMTELGARLQQYQLGAFGLHHWAGDRKGAVLAHWARLADDLEQMQDVLQRPSLYDAGVVLGDVLEIYASARTIPVVMRGGDTETVHQYLRPLVVGSFAARVGLLRHLEDHVTMLRQRVTDDTSVGHDRAVSELAVAEQLLSAAQEKLAEAGTSGKGDGAAVAELSPLLVELFGTAEKVPAALATADAATIARLSQAIADRSDAHAMPANTTIEAATAGVRAHLAACPDYEGTVRARVDHVVHLLVRFLHSRMNVQQSRRPYLYDRDASEADLHDDLYDYLVGTDLAGYVDIEAVNVGGGRADIRLSFGLFHLYLELKADDTQVALADKRAYIQQTIAYHGTDVRISFLIVLRIAPPDSKSAPPHLSDLVSHTTVVTSQGSEPRHVVMLEVPGGRVAPSAMK
jgi:hypothetical protein